MKGRRPKPRGRGLRRLLGAWGVRLLLLAASTLAALLLGELLIRFALPQQLILLRPDIWIPDETGLGWRVAPNLDTQVNTGEREVRLLTDGDGFRIGPMPRPPEAIRILALGDSFLAAVQVEYDDTMTARLEAALGRELGTPVRVVNTGVAGWDPNRYLMRARAELARRPADLVLVFLFRGSDVVGERRDAYPPRRGEVVHHLRWPRSLAGRELVKALLYPLNDALERRSHLFILARKAGWQTLMRVGLSARRFPEAELRSQVDSPRWQITGELCSEIAATAAEHGSAALFVLLPGAYHVDRELGLAYARAIGLGPDEIDLEQTSRLLGAQLSRRGLRFVDATEALARAHGQGIETHGRVDTHFAPGGHAEVARLLLPSVLSLIRDATPRLEEAGH